MAQGIPPAPPGSSSALGHVGRENRTRAGQERSPQTFDPTPLPLPGGDATGTVHWAPARESIPTARAVIRVECSKRCDLIAAEARRYRLVEQPTALGPNVCLAMPESRLACHLRITEDLVTAADYAKAAFDAAPWIEGIEVMHVGDSGTCPARSERRNLCGGAMSAMCRQPPQMPALIRDVPQHERLVAERDGRRVVLAHGDTRRCGWAGIAKLTMISSARGLMRTRA